MDEYIIEDLGGTAASLGAVSAACRKPRGLQFAGRTMGGCILVFMILVANINVRAADFYVATNGNDTAEGTWAAPFQTISQAGAVMQPGDRCLIRAGIYRETVTPVADNLFFGAYKEESVTISGCDVVPSPWQPYGDQIQQATMTQRVMQVFLDGQRMNLSRYPDEMPAQDMMDYSNWAPSTTSVPENSNGDPELGLGTVVFSGMDSHPTNYWVGGYYNGRNGINPFSAARGDIIASSGNTLTLTNLNFYWRLKVDAVSSVGDGVGYIINTLNALTAPTEWYWGDSKLYLQPPIGTDLTKSVVEARTRMWGINLSNRTGIVVEGLTFHAAAPYLGGAQACSVTNCTVLYPAPWTGYDYPSSDGIKRGMDYGGPDDGSCGMFVSGQSNRISNCRFAHSWGAALRLDGNHNVLEDSLLEDLNWLARRIGGVQLLGDGNQVLRCTIRNTGQAGIDGGNRTLGFGDVGRNLSVISNRIHDVGLLTADTGGFYINSQHDEQLVNAVVAYNTISRIATNGGYMSGIYFDNGTRGGLVHHNVVDAARNTNVKHVIKISGGDHFEVYNNTASGGSKTTINASSKNVVLNNLAVGIIQGGTTVSNNLMQVVAADHFVNADAGDFRLIAASPAINAGEVIPGITDGYVGGAPDMGAYEYGLNESLRDLPASLQNNPDPNQDATMPTDME